MKAIELAPFYAVLYSIGFGKTEIHSDYVKLLTEDQKKFIRKEYPNVHLNPR